MNSTTSTVSRENAMPDRIRSLDALRGFDMFWILGADSLGAALKKISNNPFTQAIANQLDHVEWEGFRFYDMIFPLFVFIMGVSTVLSLTKIIARDGKTSALVRVLKRGILIFVVGLIYSGGHAVVGGFESNSTLLHVRWYRVYLLQPQGDVRNHSRHSVGILGAARLGSLS
jgi:predicted acyltransferase